MEQEKLFQFMIEHTLAMMIVFDEQGKVLYANPVAEKKLKYASNLCKTSIVEIFPQEEKLKDSLNKTEEDPCKWNFGNRVGTVHNKAAGKFNGRRN